MKTASGLLFILVAACFRAGSTDTAQAPAALDEYRGKVLVTGSEPATSVRLVATGGNLELVGTLEPELRRLAGASVAARGTLQGRPPLQRLEVATYEITEIDGEVPATGMLQLRNGELYLQGRDSLRLVGAPEALRSKSGAKVWIVGSRSGADVAVQSYGVIRE